MAVMTADKPTPVGDASWAHFASLQPLISLQGRVSNNRPIAARNSIVLNGLYATKSTPVGAPEASSTSPKPVRITIR